MLMFLTFLALALCQLAAAQPNPCDGSPIKALIPNPSGDCADYFVCLNGIAIAQRCPAGFLFDFSLQMCNFKSQVECNDNAEVTPVNPGATAPTPGPKSPTLRPIPGLPTTPPSWQRITCEGRRDGVFIPDRRRGCSAYKLCHQGVVRRRDVCHDNLSFDFERQICNWPQNVDCV